MEDFHTYFGGNGNSQIDFALTNKLGKRSINTFEIIRHDWHLSDHCPISLEIAVKFEIDLSFLLVRAQDLNMTNNDTSSINQFLSNYDYAK